MLGLSGAKLIAAAVAIVAVLALIAGGYWFIAHQIQLRVDSARNEALQEVAAVSNKAALDQLAAEVRNNAAREEAFLVRLGQLSAEQAASAQVFSQAITRFESHDLSALATAKPGLVGSALTRGSAELDCLLERASGADRECGPARRAQSPAAPAGAGTAQPAQP